MSPQEEPQALPHDFCSVAEAAMVWALSPQDEPQVLAAEKKLAVVATVWTLSPQDEPHAEPQDSLAEAAFIVGIMMG